MPGLPADAGLEHDSEPAEILDDPGDEFRTRTGEVDILDPQQQAPACLSRQRERGYNQAEELARIVARDLTLPVETSGLRRVRATGTQTQLGRSERAANVRGAFAWGGAPLDGRRVLLIDDVMTTGATLDACAAALKVAGAGTVWAATVARG